MPVVTPYEAWMEREELPVLGGLGVPDVRATTRAPWRRTGGRGAFIHLRGMEGFTGMHVGEIPAGASLLPQKHMYEQFVYILDGRGAAEVRQPGDGADGRAVFEWGRGSLFATPLNCWYQLHNAASTPALYLSVNNAPLVIDLFHDEDFVFRSDFRFERRFRPAPDFFAEGVRRMDNVGSIWETNFVADVEATMVDNQALKGSGVQITNFHMADNALGGHISAWPVGRYHKAHHHQGGAIILILRSRGYSLMWPLEAGVHPYADGRADAVARFDWGVGAIFSPPSKWYHQHFNTGPEPARQLAFHFGGRVVPTGFHRAASVLIDGVPAHFVSHRRGGNMIEYEDEDPRIRQDYERDAAGLSG